MDYMNKPDVKQIIKQCDAVAEGLDPDMELQFNSTREAAASGARFFLSQSVGRNENTLNKIRACSPCASGWAKLLGNLGKTKADDEPLASQRFWKATALTMRCGAFVRGRIPA